MKYDLFPMIFLILFRVSTSLINFAFEELFDFAQLENLEELQYYNETLAQSNDAKNKKECLARLTALAPRT